MNVIQDRPPLMVDIQTEAQTRLHLCALYRLLAHFRMEDLIFTHASAKVPGENAFLINPFGLRFDEVTPQNLIKIDYQGMVDGDDAFPANAAGYVIHSAILAARQDIGCVIHTHTRAGVALSCLEEGLLPINQFAIEFYNRVGYHDYEGIAFNLDEGPRLRHDLADNIALVLRNHGLLTVGPNIPAAFYLMYYLEQAAQVQIDVMSTGRPFVTPSTAMLERAVAQFTSSFNPPAAGQRMWPSLLSLLDERYPNWRNGFTA